jgi:predicted phosphohydrolase
MNTFHMKIRYFSDLHLEFIKPQDMDNFIRQIPSGIDEICVLAGDIGNPFKSNYQIFMKFISVNFKKIFVIPGNHEYYQKRKTIQETNDFMKQYFEPFHNISFLNNDYEMYENHCFIGTTLWSTITDPSHAINDMSAIPNFDYIQYNKLNRSCIDFLESIHHEKCILITHYIPSESLIDVKYKTKEYLPYNQWYYCNMDHFIEKNKHSLTCWIYGHTHTPSSVWIHDIPFVCNPIGYPNENSVLDFNKCIIIEDE